jgi:hypothetical protein
MKTKLACIAAAAVLLALFAGCAGPKRSVTTAYWMEDHLYVAYWESVSFTEGAKVIKCDLDRRANAFTCKEQENVTKITAPPGLWKQLTDLPSALPSVPGLWK